MAVGKREWVEEQFGGRGKGLWEDARSGTTPSTSSSSSNLGIEDGGEEGASAIWVGAEGRGLLGVLGLRDTLRPDARETVDRLRGMGMR